jgi:hypothetical protein
MAYRGNPHGTSGYSPYLLLHGRDDFVNFTGPQGEIDVRRQRNRIRAQIETLQINPQVSV